MPIRPDRPGQRLLSILTPIEIEVSRIIFGDRAQSIPILDLNTTSTEGDQGPLTEFAQRPVDVNAREPKTVGKVGLRHWQVETAIVVEPDQAKPDIQFAKQRSEPSQCTSLTQPDLPFAVSGRIDVRQKPIDTSEVRMRLRNVTKSCVGNQGQVA